MIDVAKLIAEISPEQPCGENLEYDLAYRKLLTDAKGKPAQYKGQELIVSAEEPDWPVIRDASLELLSRTRDLDLAIHLAASLLKTDGLAGFRDGLKLISGLLEQRWDHVHPQLDPEDPDPLARINLLSALSPSGGYADEAALRFPEFISQAPLSLAKAHRVCYRDVRVARGELPPSDEPGKQPMDKPAIDGMLRNAPPDDLQNTIQALDDSISCLNSIENVFRDKAGDGSVPNLQATTSLLTSMKGYLNTHVAAPAGGPAVEAGGQVAAGLAAPAVGGTSAPITGEIASPDDVVRMLDKICAYYRVREPSSPVPLLLNRAKGLVAKNFLDIIGDLTPEMVAQMRNLGGIREPENPEQQS